MAEPTSQTTIIECPLCGLPHRQGATVCDACRQPLGMKLDFQAMRRELKTRKLHAGLAIAAITGMLTLNILVFGGGAYLVGTAPCIWLGWSVIRWRKLERALARETSTSLERYPL